MKQDLLGRTVTTSLNGDPAAWLFGRQEDIKAFRLIEATFQNENFSYIANVEMRLLDYNKNDLFQLTGLIIYAWDFNLNTWNFQNIIAQEYHKIE